MTKEKFYNEVEEGLKRHFGAGTSIEIQEVKKVNITLDGVVIRKENSNIAPTIYLNPYFLKFNDGESLDEILRDIIDVYENNQPDKISECFKVEDFFDFDKAKSGIVLKVVNAEKNADLLQSVPHKMLDGLGLAAIYYLELTADANASAGIMIKNEHLKLWNVNESELLALATENTNRNHKFTIRSLTEIMMQEFSGEGFEFSEEELEAFEGGMPTMYVLNDQNKTFGASQLFLKDAIKEFAEKNNCDVYILPSSVRELLLLRADVANLEPDYLRNMVCEVNQTTVSESDFLYDGAFKYILDEDKIVEI